MSTGRRLVCRGLVTGIVMMLALAFPGTGAAVQKVPMARRSPPPLLLGADWYPEQWPESRWPADLELMQKAHVHVVRLGEFAWTALEPSEGNYHFGWLERAIDMAGQHGIYVIIGTPTAAPPVWMATKYPGILVTLSDGRRYAGATRNRDNWNSTLYRQFVRDIDTRLARHFGHNPWVIGWQIDNEYSCQSFGPATQAQFHQWLRQRYGTIAALNKDWTTAYNNQTYSGFDEVPLVSGTQDNNPGLWLASKRFISYSLRGYQRVQINAIRRYADPRQKITTNMMAWYGLYNPYTVGQDLDIISIDNPQTGGSFHPVANGAIHDMIRGIKGQNYWVMETTAGPRGGDNASQQLPRGVMADAVWSYIGHGADLVNYWQWRDALNGGEANHGALVGVNGKPNLLYSEWARVGAEFDKAGPAIKNTHVRAHVAILYSYPSRLDIDWQKMNPKYDAISLLMSYYAPLHKLGYTIDIVPPTRDLTKYSLVIAPGLELLTQSEADNLESYVRNGGHLVLGQRSGMKDVHNSRWPQKQPGPMVPFLGAHVEQYQALGSPICVNGLFGHAKAILFAEMLRTDSPQTKVLMRYQAPHSWLDGQPAAVTRKIGKGQFTYIGAWLDKAGVRREVEWMVQQANVKPDLFPVPAGVDVYKRVGTDHDVYIVENSSTKTATVQLPFAMKNLLSGGLDKTLMLPAYGYSVLLAKRQ